MRLALLEHPYKVTKMNMCNGLFVGNPARTIDGQRLMTLAIMLRR